VTQPNVGSRGSQVATVVPLGTARANGSVAAGAETWWSDSRDGEMHDVFIVISVGKDGEHVARTVCAASEDDARRTHQENYPDEPIVTVHQ
jgi:hypothetical protein